MRLNTPFVKLSLCFAVSFLIAQQLVARQNVDQGNWGQWRGPKATGASDTAEPPIRWSETENIRWKVALPGLGHSSPVVWGNRVFVTSAIPFGSKFEPIPDNAPGSHDNLPVSQRHKYVVLAIDRADGNILWEKVVNENIPHEGAHYSGSLASASPVTDGEHIYAHFGSHGLYCLDFDGQIVWKKNFEKMHSKHGHGEGSSPVLFENTLVINWDHEGQSFVVALDKNTGAEIWKKQRNEVTSWSSPVVVEVDGKAQLIVAGSDRVRGYDLTDGTTIWECSGLSQNVCASPVAENGILIVGSSYDTKAMFAIDLHNARGDLTGTKNVLWHRTQRTPYVPSPLLYKGKVYFFSHYQGILSEVDAKTGEEAGGPFRINGLGEIYSSPVAAHDRIYMTGRTGVTIVASHPEMPRMLSANRLDDSFSASPALVGKEIFLRGEKHLYCVGREPEND